jgi:hypothetical protein
MFKGTEGVVLAADSRVTLTVKTDKNEVSAHYDNAIKVLHVKSQPFIAAVTYGLGALGSSAPRTAHSYLSEFEAKLAPDKRLKVSEFAELLGDFFLAEHGISNTPKNANDMVFLVGGYDKDVPYPCTYEVKVPNSPKPVEWNKDKFGLVFGGQNDIARRLLNPVDQSVLQYFKDNHKLSDEDIAKANKEFQKKLGLSIPYQFLPLQDCVDLSILLVKTTAQLMQYSVGVRGVGGAIDVATITRDEGYKPVQFKRIRGASRHGARYDF